jgi:hypothetical protein
MLKNLSNHDFLKPFANNFFAYLQENAIISLEKKNVKMQPIITSCPPSQKK